MIAYDAIVFPSDDRPPHLEALMTNPIQVPLMNPAQPYLCGRMPHPEVYMDYIAEGMGPRAWQFHVSILFAVSRRKRTPGWNSFVVIY